MSIVKKYFHKSLDKNGRHEVLSKKTGKIKLIKHYLNNALDGDYTYYWDNGNIMFKGAFKNNRRFGSWKNFDNAGILIFEENY